MSKPGCVIWGWIFCQDIDLWWSGDWRRGQGCWVWGRGWGTGWGFCRRVWRGCRCVPGQCRSSARRGPVGSGGAPSLSACLAEMVRFCPLETAPSVLTSFAIFLSETVHQNISLNPENGLDSLVLFCHPGQGLTPAYWFAHSLIVCFFDYWLNTVTMMKILDFVLNARRWRLAFYEQVLEGSEQGNCDYRHESPDSKWI